MKISRRDFLKTSTATTAAMTLSGGMVQNVLAGADAAMAGPGNKWPGRVVINFNKNALTGTATEQANTLKSMVDDSILKLTDQTELGAAWKAVFPATLTATSKIAIKVPLGYASNPCGPHWRHVKAMVDGLRLMDFGGPKFTGTITIYDNYGGNNLNTFGFNTTNFPGVSILQDGIQSFGDGAQGNRAYSKTLNAANFLINVFTPRGHSSYGLTLGFKNHFGTYNPSAHDLDLTGINSTGPVYNKTVLCMCSAIYANSEGQGPSQGPTNYSTYAKKMDTTATGTNANTLVLSTDPVSAELQGIKIMRMNSNGGFTANDMPGYLKSATSLGIINEAQMDIRRLINVTTSVDVPGAGLGKTISAHVSASHVKGSTSTFIQYAVPSNLVGNDISFEIYDARGSLVRKLSDKAMGNLSHFAWDERDASNDIVRSGNYVVRLIAGSTKMAAQLSIMR
jgi:hypothetical protein